MLRINTPSAYLVKGDEKLKLGDRLYDKDEVNGYKSMSHRVHIVDTETGEAKVLFPGQVIEYKTAPKKKTAVKRKPRAKTKVEEK